MVSSITIFSTSGRKQIVMLQKLHVPQTDHAFQLSQPLIRSPRQVRQGGFEP